MAGKKATITWASNIGILKVVNIASATARRTFNAKTIFAIIKKILLSFSIVKIVFQKQRMDIRNEKKPEDSF